jgi:hypothetical protein
MMPHNTIRDRDRSYGAVVARHGHPGQAYRTSLALAGSCDPMLLTITTSEYIGIKMRRSLARFSGLESSAHSRYSADFNITTSAF